MPSPSERLIAGRYRLRRQLGQGSMGTVWEAFDEFLRRPVAVKEVLLPTGISDADADELRERTLREARAIAALSHPNVITLHDVAREDGDPFVVTEYMPAHSLAELLAVLGPLTAAKAAAIGDAVAAGLAAAHQAGITHRDVKPGNVLVGSDGQVKLTDFGIARNVSERTLTRTGIMLGSPCYIAPEVASGGEVAPAADLWGLGATLFAAVEGHPPYEGVGTVVEIVSQVVHGEVPRPSVDGPLTEVVAALMVKDPAGRISLAEVRNRLHPLLPPPSTPLLSAADLERLATPASTAPASTGPPAGSTPREPVGSTPREPAEESPAEPAPAESSEESAGLVAGAEPVSLATAPGPLPFAPARPHPRRRRSGLVTASLVAVSVLVFLAAAGGGFALARVVGAEPLLPPQDTRAPASPRPRPEPPVDELVTRSGDAATVLGAEGGGYSVRVPADWVRFVEERVTEELSSTRVYFVSTDGTRALTVERIPGFAPDHSIEEYVGELSARQDVAFEEIDRAPTRSLGPGEQAQQLTYRTSAQAERLAPADPRARNLNRVTFANLLTRAGDLWVVSVTVPVEQEDTGRRELFDRIAPTFGVTG